MLAQGKTPKVLTAATRQEPVIDIPEGETGRKPCDTRPVRALFKEKIAWRFSYWTKRSNR
ncbi:hypothetical protein HAALTHF_01070n [Vreelandella aquamarina]|nr:hypothetical protein HAALTHF_01070n [Halomonas axialensis]